MMSGDLDIDWQINKSLLECASHLCLSPHLSDVSFLFPDEDPPERLPAHKLILALRSPVFETMFFGSMPPGETVTIIDASSASFKALLKFIYTDRFEFDSCHIAGETMQTAHKYQVPLLAEFCASNLENSIAVDNVFSTLSKAILYDLKKLQNKCVDFIEKNTEDAFGSDDFLQSSSVCLELILQSDNLALDEIYIYKATVLWAKEECRQQDIEATGENMRLVLGPVFGYLRIPHIPLVEFSDTVSRDGLLTNSEIIQVFRYHTLKLTECLDFVKCARRKSPCLMISRIQEALRWTNDKRPWRCETIKFRVCKPAVLTGIGVLNMAVQGDSVDDNELGTSHLLAVEITDLHVSCLDSDSDDDIYLPPIEAGVFSFTFPLASMASDRFQAELPKPVDLIAYRWYNLDLTVYSFNKTKLSTMLKGKSFCHLQGSAIKTKVTLDSGLWAEFKGTSHGPIHSLYLRPTKKAATPDKSQGAK